MLPLTIHFPLGVDVRAKSLMNEGFKINQDTAVKNNAVIVVYGSQATLFVCVIKSAVHFTCIDSSMFSVLWDTSDN